MSAAREFINSVSAEDAAKSVDNVRVTREHCEEALDEVGPSVDEETREQYEELEDEFGPGQEPDEPEVSRTFQ